MRPYKDYRWIVADPDLLGGKPTIRGTRLSVEFILGCLAESMSLDEIADTYAPFPRKALPEVFRLASDAVATRNVAA